MFLLGNAYESGDAFKDLDSGMFLSILSGFLVFLLIMWLLSSFINMRFYNKLGYNNTWFAFLPIVSTYIMFKVIYDAFNVKYLEENGKTAEFVDKRRSSVIKWTIGYMALAVVVGIMTAMIESAVNPKLEISENNLNESLSFDTVFHPTDLISMIIGLIVTFIFIKSVYLVTRKKGTNSNKEVSNGKVLLVSILSTFLYIPYLIFMWIKGGDSVEAVYPEHQLNNKSVIKEDINNNNI